MTDRRLRQRAWRTSTAIALVLLPVFAAAPATAAASQATSTTVPNSLTLLLAQARQGEAAPTATQTVSPYRWLASRTASGPTVLTGYVPANALKTMIAAQAPGAVNRLQVAAGAPASFAEDATAAMAALDLLDNGKVGFDGAVWYVSGTLKPGITRPDLTGVLGDAATPAERWSITVGEASATAQADSPSVTTLDATAPNGETADSTAAGDANSIETLPTAPVAPAAAEAEAAPESPPTTATEAAAPAVTATTAAPTPVETTPEAAPVEPQAEAAPATEVAPSEPTTEATAPANAAAPDAVAPAATEAPAETTPETTAPAEPAPAETTPTEPTPATEPATPVAPSEPATPVVAEPAAPSVDVNYSFAAEKSATGIVTFSGTVPADATRRYFGVVAGGVDASALAIAPGAPESFISSGTEGLRALAQLSEGRLSFSNGKWSLSGKAESETKQSAIESTVAALPEGNSWTVNVTAPTALEVCQSMAEAFSARNPILFESGKATIAEASAAAVDELATDLKTCPQGAVNVEGHTDADGAEDLNLTLSVARAEAVVNALVERGVDAGRLYAIGYGETLPIADNETAAGKRQNRRIVIKVMTPEEAAKQ